jgi:hypothetical protein
LSHHNPVAVNPTHFYRRACLDESTVGYDIDATAINLGYARGSQRRQCLAGPAQPVPVALGRGDVAEIRLHSRFEHETPPEREVGQKTK